jgi:hypothetical protein
MTNKTEFSKFCGRLLDLIRAFSSGSGKRPAPDSFGELALELFALQFDSVASYRGFCRARRVRPENVSRWQEIPAIPAGAFKEFDVSSLPCEERVSKFVSSGTTAQDRSRHFHSPESLGVYEASLWAWFKTHLTPSKLDRCLFLTPSAEDAPSSSLVHMLETIRGELGMEKSVFFGRADKTGGWLLDVDRAVAELEKLSGGNHPVLLLGTAFSYVQLLDELALKGKSVCLPPGSRAMETGGYKGRSRVLSRSELRRLITGRLGIPATGIVSEYGMSELSSQAYDLTPGLDQSVFRFPPWVRAQVISMETGLEVGEGETGLIRVFDLANVRSVLALQTEDLAVKRGEGFELVGRAAIAEPRGCSLMIIDNIAA